KHLLNLMQDNIEIVRQETNQLLFLLYHQQNNLLTSDDVLIRDLQEEIDQLDYYSEQNYLLLDQLSDPKKLDHEGFVLEISKDRKSTRLNSSHVSISYAVFCLKTKNKKALRDDVTLTQT